MFKTMWLLHTQKKGPLSPKDNNGAKWQQKSFIGTISSVESGFESSDACAVGTKSLKPYSSRGTAILSLSQM